MKPFLINYQHRGEQYALELHATDVEDAKARLNSLLYGRVCGEITGKLPAPLGPLASLICWFRNSAAR